MININNPQTNSFNTLDNISTNSPLDQKEINQSKNNDLANDKTICFNSNDILENKKNDLCYKSFLSKIKLYYYLKHPKKREQTIILNTSLNKSKDSSLVNQSIDNINKNSIDFNSEHQQKIIMVEKNENGEKNYLIGDNNNHLINNNNNYKNESINKNKFVNLNNNVNEKIETYEQIRNYANSKRKTPFNENRLIVDNINNNYEFHNNDINIKKDAYDNNNIYKNDKFSHNIVAGFNKNERAENKIIDKNNNLDFTNSYEIEYDDDNLYNNNQINNHTNQNNNGNINNNFYIHNNELNKEESNYFNINSNDNIKTDLNERNITSNFLTNNDQLYNDLNSNKLNNISINNKNNQLKDNNKKIVSNIFNNYQPTSENSFKDKIFLSENNFEENYPIKQTSDTTSDISNNLTNNIIKNNLEVDNQNQKQRNYFDLNKIKFSDDILENSQKNSEINEVPYTDKNNVYEFEKNTNNLNKNNATSKTDEKKIIFSENQEISNKNLSKNKNTKRYTVDQKNYNNIITNDDAIKLNVNDKQNYEIKNNSDKKKSINKEFNYNNYSINNSNKKNLNSLNELANPFKAQRSEILVNRIDEITDNQNINNNLNSALNHNNIKNNNRNSNVPIGNIFINNIINQQDNKNDDDNTINNHENIILNNNDITAKENENEEEIEYEDDEIQINNKDNILNNNYNNNFDNNNILQNEDKILDNRNQKLFNEQSNNLNNNLILPNDQNFYDKTFPKSNENIINFNNNQLSSFDKNNNINDEIFSQNPNNLIYNENQQQNNLLIKNSNEIDNEKIPTNERYLAALLYGILFGAASIGIYSLCNKSKRNYLHEKLKNINVNSIVYFFKHLLHPINFFKSIFNNDKLEIYKRAFALSLIQIFDFLEQYGDEFRILGKFILVYGFWLFFKTLFRTAIKIWKYCTK